MKLNIESNFKQNHLKYVINDINVIYNSFNNYKDITYKIPFSIELLNSIFILKPYIKNVYKVLKMLDYYKANEEIIKSYINLIDKDIIISLYDLLFDYDHIKSILQDVIINYLSHKDYNEINIIKNKYNLYFINSNEIKNKYYNIEYKFNKIVFDDYIQFKIIKSTKLIVNINIKFLSKYFKYFNKHNICIRNNNVLYYFELGFILSNITNINPMKIISNLDIYKGNKDIIDYYLKSDFINIKNILEIYYKKNKYKYIYQYINTYIDNYIKKLNKYQLLEFIILNNIKFLNNKIINNSFNNKHEFKLYKEVFLINASKVIDNNILNKNHVIFDIRFFDYVVPKLYKKYFIEPSYIENNKIYNYKILLNDIYFASYHINKNIKTQFYFEYIYNIHKEKINELLQYINIDTLNNLIKYDTCFKNEVLDFLFLVKEYSLKHICLKLCIKIFKLFHCVNVVNYIFNNNHLYLYTKRKLYI